MGFQFLNLLLNVPFQIGESLEGGRRYHSRSGLLLEPRAKILIFEGQHAAVRVVDDDNLLSPEQVMGNDEGS